MIMARRYQITHRRTTWGGVVYQVIDGRSGEEVFDFLTLNVASRRADTLNQAYEMFFEATASWHRSVAA
jgi:hypothetical protein